MGDQNFMGGLLGGLAQGLQQQQEMALKKEYQKSLIDINKLHGKLYEAQVNASDLETSVLQSALKKAGVLGGGGAPQQEAPAAQAGAQPAPPMWGPGSEGGVSRQMAATGPPARQFEDRFLEGFLKKKWGMEGDEVLIKPYGDHVGAFSKKTGTLLGIYPGQGKSVMQEITLPGGAKAIQPMIAPPAPLPPGVPVFGGQAIAGQGGLPGQPPVLGQGGQATLTAPRPFKYGETIGTGGEINQRVEPTQPLPGEDYQKKPPVRDMPQEVPNEAKQKLVGMKTFVSQLEQLADAGTNDKNLFGSLKELQYRTGRTFFGGLPLVGDMIRSDPKMASFMQLHDTVHATRLFEMGGKQATAMELQTIMNTLATTKDWETFKTQSKVAVKLAKELEEQVKTSYREPERNLLAPTKSLPPGAKPTNRTSGGKPVYQLPDGRYVVE